MKLTRKSIKLFFNTSPLGGVSHVSAISSRLLQDFYEACHTKNNLPSGRWFSSKKDEKGNSSHNPSSGEEGKIEFIKPGGDNCFINKDTNIEYVRVFGKWKCLTCKHRWYSAFTWIASAFCLNNKDLCRDSIYNEQTKSRNMIKVFDGSGIKDKDLLLELCKNCKNRGVKQSKNSKNVKIISYSNLKKGVNNDPMIPHRSDLCLKCLNNNPCKRYYSTSSRFVTQASEPLSLAKVLHTKTTLLSNLNHKNICYFSSSTSDWGRGDGIKSFNDFREYVTSDGGRFISLPSIENKVEFMRDLANVLFLLSKEKDEFKLDYYLYLHCNDEKKELLHFMANESWLESNFDLKSGNPLVMGGADVQMYTMGLMLLDKMYDHKGFSLIHSTNFDRASLLKTENLNKYINDVRNVLGKCVVDTNEKRLDLDEFIEFKKSSLVGITKINNPKN